MKWLIRIGLVVVLLMVVTLVGVVVMIDRIATTGVREGVAFATQTDVGLTKVDVHLFSAGADIEGLDIKNPEGFTQTFPSFMKLGNGSATVSARSLRSDLIEIPKVELSDIEITLVGLDGKKNYEVILESLKRFQGDEPPAETKGQKQVVIREVIIRNITVRYDLEADPSIGALIPVSGEVLIAHDQPMVLNDVGAGGVPLSQVSADLITGILIQVMANTAGNLGDHVVGLTGSLAETLGVDQLQETLGELGLTDFDLGENLKAFTEATGEIIEGAGDVIRGIGEGAGGLINNITGDDDDDDSDDNSGGSILDRGRNLINGGD